MKKMCQGLLIAAALAACKKENTCTEILQPGCGCYKIYQPVCGCNGKTYGNDCEAECFGIYDYTPGECH